MSWDTVPYLAAPGKERPDWTVFTAPAATVTDTSAEEIELDQALSLAGRFGRDYLGMAVIGVLGTFAAEHQTVTGADHVMTMTHRLQSRTGAFGFADPETLDEIDYAASYQAGATDTSGSVMNPIKEQIQFGEPELYVAPRLFFRIENDMDASLSAADYAVRIGSVSRKLTFELFVELLERFADVTLL